MSLKDETALAWRYASLREAPLWLVLRHPSWSAADVRAFVAAAAASLAVERGVHEHASLAPLDDQTSGGAATHSSLFLGKEALSESRKRSRSPSPSSGHEASSAASALYAGKESSHDVSLEHIHDFASRWQRAREAEGKARVPQPTQYTTYTLEEVALDSFLKTSIYYASLFPQTQTRARHGVNGQGDDAACDERAERPICLVLAPEDFLSLTHSRGGLRGAAAHLARVVDQLRATQDKVAASMKKSESPSWEVVQPPLSGSSSCTPSVAPWRPPRKLGCLLFGPRAAQPSAGASSGGTTVLHRQRMEMPRDAMTAAILEASRKPASVSGSVMDLRGGASVGPSPRAPAMAVSTPSPVKATGTPFPSPGRSPGVVSQVTAVTGPATQGPVNEAGALPPTSPTVAVTDPVWLREVYPPLTLDLFDCVLVV